MATDFSMRVAACCTLSTLVRKETGGEYLRLVHYEAAGVEDGRSCHTI